MPHKLLLTCLRTGEIQKNLADFGPIAADLWTQMVACAQQQGVAPLLYWRLKPLTAQGSVPSALVAALADAYHYHTARNMRLYHELARVLTVLQRAQIPVIVLKGAFLAERVYPEIGLRPMSDMDLLVHPEDAAQVAEHLAALGYHPKQPLFIAEHFAIHQHLPPFVKASSQTMIEVHGNITPPNQVYSIDVAQLWARARPITLAGVPTQSLAPEDLLLHLCAHLSYQHLCVTGIGSLYDLVPLLADDQNCLDWEMLCRRAQQWGWSRGVYLVFALANTLLGAQIPADVLARLQPPDFHQGILQEAQRQLFGTVTVNDLPSINFVRLLYSRQVTEIVRLLLGRFFPTPHELSAIYGIRVGDPTLYGYYAVRAKDLLFRYSAMAWQRFQQDEIVYTQTKRQHTLFGWLQQA